MGWITYDYGCDACGHVRDELVDRADVPETLPCPECGGVSVRRVGCLGVMNVALPDGTRRFQGIREQRVLQKAAKRAFKRRDKKEQARVQQEMNKLSKR
jgi:putative FmdB family regulatory protein